jgi:hypothetical protein
MRRLWRAIRWLLLALLVLVGGVLALNLVDDRLDPGAKAMLEARVETVPRQENLYYMALGFGTTGNDPEQAGWDEAQSVGEDLRSGKNVYDLFNLKRPEQLQLVGKHEDLPRSGDLQGAIDLLRRDPELVGRFLSENARLRERYDRLHVYTRFVSAIPDGEIAIVQPEWGLMFEGQRLEMLELARKVVAGRTGEVVDWLNRDAAFWRRMLAEAHPSMSDKFMLGIFLRRDFQMASQLVHAGHLDAAQLEGLSQVATSLSEAERSMAGVWEVEFRKFVLETSASSAPSSPESLSDRLQRLWGQPFYLRNATINRMYRNTLALQEASGHACSRFEADRAGLLNATSPATWNTLRNSGGAILSSIAMPVDLDYVSHTCDLQGFQRLLALQILLRQRAPGDADIPALIRSAGAEYMDPYSDAPMRWVPEQRALGFGARSGGARGSLPWAI